VDSENIRGVVVAGERSGAGKTMLTLALASSFARRGRTVQCFKVGPDFIDAGYHSLATGRQSRNLDGWMMGMRSCLSSFAENTRDADIAIVEGVMGLFDGADGRSDDGSTAQIARWLGLPVILVVDGSSFARTAGALVLGFERFDPSLTVAGVLFNRVAGERHYACLRDGVRGSCRAGVLGYVPRSDVWQVPSRHLGLVMAHEQKDIENRLQRLGRQIEETVDLEAVSGCCRPPGAGVPVRPGAPPATAAGARAVIGVARDEAFCFYYQDNIELLEQAGAEIVYFSPLHDGRLPEGLQGLYLGGGYPELYARALQDNRRMREAVCGFCASGRPVYAECGGFLYLLRSLTDRQGLRCDMAGVFPADAAVRPRLQRLGYVEIEALPDCPFPGQGETVRGHEFHYSDITAMPSGVGRSWRVRRNRSGELFEEGYRINNVLAGYMHVHFASNPAFPRDFVARCRQQAAVS